MIEIRHLKCMVTLAEQLHFKKAARNLFLSQPTLTQSIHQLEEELGVVLFPRTSRSVALTNAGRVFLAAAKHALEQVDLAIQAARQEARREQSTITLGHTPSIMFTGFPATVRKFQKLHPAVKIELIELSIEPLQQQLRRGSIDLAFADEDISCAEFESKCVGVYPFVLGVPTSHRLASHSSVRLHCIKDDIILVPSRTRLPHLYKLVHNTYCAAGFTPRESVEVDSLPGAVGAIAANLGVALVPSLASMIARKDIVYLKIDQKLNMEMRLFWRTAQLSAAGKNLVDLF